MLLQVSVSWIIPAIQIDQAEFGHYTLQILSLATFRIEFLIYNVLSKLKSNSKYLRLNQPWTLEVIKEKLLCHHVW